MFARTIRMFAVAAFVAGSMTVVAAASSAVPGTWSKITTPGNTTIYKFNGSPTATNHLAVSGTTSIDVTSVDIECIFGSLGNILAQEVATAVPVTAGSCSADG